MEFEFGAALIAGLIAGMAMEIPMMAMMLGGFPPRMNILYTWGTMMGVHGMGALAAGTMVHFVLSAAVGLIYAWGFDFLFNASDNLWLWGLLGAAIHYTIGGMFVAMMPAMHPEIPEVQPVPGAFISRLGARDVGHFLVAHAFYGLTFGIAYGFLHSGGGQRVVF